MNYSPLVSVVVPFYNIEAMSSIFYLTIRSVLVQTYRNIEIVLVNDGSTDMTEKIVNNLIPEIDKSGFKVKYVSHEINLGSSIARNTGVKHSSGSYIAFLDSDDLFIKDYISIVVNSFQEDPTREVIISSGYYLVDFYDKRKVYQRDLDRITNLKKEELIYYFIEHSFPFPVGSSTVCKKEVFSKVKFSEYLSKKSAEDVDFAYQLLLHGYSIHFIYTPLIVQQTYLRFVSRSRSSLINCDELDINSYLLQNSRLVLLNYIKDKIAKGRVSKMLENFKRIQIILKIQSYFFQRKLIESISFVLFKPWLYKYWLRYFFLCLFSSNKFFEFIFNFLYFLRIKSDKLLEKKITDYLTFLSRQ